MGPASLVSREAPPPIVRARGLRKRYGPREAVQAIDLVVRPGQLYGLVGPDGAGKSSILKAVAGVLTFDAGDLEVFGVRIDSEAAADRVKDRIGFMPQGLGLSLYPDLSVEENVEFFAHLRLVPGVALAERARHLLAITRLDRFRHRAMKHLSGGMKQKLGLVCTLIHEPALVILDEPTTGVDPVSRRDFWTALAQLQRERGITALVSTAYMDEADRFDDLSLLFGGRVLASGDPGRLRALVPGCAVAARVTSERPAWERLRARYPEVRLLGPWLRAFVEESDPAVAAEGVRQALAGLEVSELATRPPDLEDVFVALMRRGGVATVAPPMPETGPLGVERAGSRAPIEAAGLTRDFGEFRAVDGVSFRVARGEIFGLLGANGAGKTTVIKMLTGILRPTAGTGQVAGADMTRARRTIKARIGYMSQAFSLYQDLSVIENIRLYAGIYGLGAAETRRRADWVIGWGGLAGHEGDPAGSLPVGLRQRLALGCALVHRPEVLFLDEPTSGVDPAGRRGFWEILGRLSREGGVAILITTHDMSETEQCDRLALMFAGRIVADATPAELKRQVEAEAGHPLEISAEPPILALETLRRHGFPDATVFGRKVRVFSRQPGPDAERVRGLLAAAGLDVRGITPSPVSMDDVFLRRVSALERGETARSAGAA